MKRAKPTEYDAPSGWRSLIVPLIKECKTKNVTITQIKEKFGGLRFYVDGADDALFDKILEAERKSFTMCEICGESAQTTIADHGQYRTLCDKHCYQETVERLKAENERLQTLGNEIVAAWGREDDSITPAIEAMKLELEE